MADYYSNSLFSVKNITTPTILKGIFLEELLVITPKVILFISQTDLMKYLQMPVNGRNLENSPLVTPKGHPRVCRNIFIIPQLQPTAIDNVRINTIDTITNIDRINCINQYKENRYNRSNLLKLHTSPTQLNHYFLILLITQKGMAYWCVYHGHLFLPEFILLTEPSSFVPGDINCNK